MARPRVTLRLALGLACIPRRDGDDDFATEGTSKQASSDTSGSSTEGMAPGDWCRDPRLALSAGRLAAAAALAAPRRTTSAIVLRMREPARFLSTWIAAMLGFEALGFGLAFSLGFVVQAIVLADAPAGTELARPATIGLALLVGAVEGTTLATGQWLLLRRRIPQLRWRSWAGATAIGGALPWALGMALGTSLESAPPAWLIGVGFVVTGLVFGGILGACQALVLRRHLRIARRWIAANALGWMVGLAATYVASALIDEQSPVALALVLGLAAGAAMALLPALLTGLVLQHASTRP